MIVLLFRPRGEYHRPPFCLYHSPPPGGGGGSRKKGIKMEREQKGLINKAWQRSLLGIKVRDDEDTAQGCGVMGSRRMGGRES